MRVVLQILIALVFMGAGVLFGAFNSQAVKIDFHWFLIPATLGVALLVALFIGAVLGGIAVTAGIVWPLRRHLRKARRELATSRPAAGMPASKQSTDPA